MKVPSNDTSFDNEELQAFTQEREYEEHVREASRPKPNPIVNCIFSAIAYVQFFWVYHRTETILGLILIGSVTLAVTGTIEAYEVGKHRHQKRTHSIKHDYSGVQSALELKLSQIDHWCLDGGDKSCPRCDDPIKAMNRVDNRGWQKAFHQNKKEATRHNTAPVDVVFLGDGTIEARSGRFYGGKTGEAPEMILGLSKKKKTKYTNEEVWGSYDVQELLEKSKKKFDAQFDKSSGAPYSGIASGITGDTSPNLLWRIQHSEIGALRPKIWWLNIGINDLVSTECSEEITLMGIIRVIEELMGMDDDAAIVVNSLLPTANRPDLKLEGKNNHNKYWPSIIIINERLKKFASKHKMIKFFDATDILTYRRGRSLYMNKELFEDKFHLSAKGQAALLKEQAAVVGKILAKKEDGSSGSSYRDTTGGSSGSSTSTSGSEHEAAKTEFEKKEEEFMANEDDLYGYKEDAISDDFFQLTPP